MNRLLLILTLVLTLVLTLGAASSLVLAQEPPELTLEGLLEAVRSGRMADSENNATRMQQFRKDKSAREAMLNEIIAEEKRQEAISEQREAKFEEHEQRIGGHG